MPSCHCCGIEDQFDRARARRDLQHYHRRGPLPATRRLLRALGDRPRTGATVLDIGGGVGVIHHELLRRGFASATHVDRSQAFIDIARQEAASVGHAGRVELIHGDFRAVAASLAPADVVTLDRVICCDPDFATLLPLAADRARHTLGLSVPRDRWYVRLFVTLENAWRRLRGSDFRVYVHSTEAMDALLRQVGLHRTRADATIVWSIEIWERGR
jgi:magnesium-protoporphyrin O-methyltransferase